MPDWMTYIASVGQNRSAFINGLMNFPNLTFAKDFRNGNITAEYSLGSNVGTYACIRSSSNPATFVDINGIIKTTTQSNVIRTTYGFHNSTGLVSCLGYLSEPVSTNRLAYSEDMSQAVWVKTNLTQSSEWVTPAIFSPSNNYGISFNKNNLEAIRCQINSNVDVYDSSIANAPFSAEAWIYTRSNGRSSLGIVFNKGYESQYSPAAHGYQMHVYSGASGFVKLGANVRHNTGLDADQATAADGATNGSVPLNAWTHVCMVYNEDGNKEIKTYVNGSAITLAGSTQNGTGAVVNDSMDQLYIGNKKNGSCTFDGIIKDVRIYHNKALSAAEVMNNYNGTPTAGSTAYFDFVEGGGTSLTDSVSSINAYCGTISSSILTISSLPWYQQVNTLTSNSNSSNILQNVSASMTTRNYSVFLMRKTGTGDIQITCEGNTLTTVVINSSSWLRHSVTANASNNTAGIMIANTSDAIYVIASQLEDYRFSTSIIPTDTSSLTRNADTLSYLNSSNRTAATESLFAKITPTSSFGTEANTRTIFNSLTKGRAFFKAINTANAMFQPNITDSPGSLSRADNPALDGVSVVYAGICQSVNDPNSSMYVDGVLQTTSSNSDFTVPAWGSTFHVGNNASNLNQLSGILERICFYSDFKTVSAISSITNVLNTF